MWGTPAGVIQALCEQGVMSITAGDGLADQDGVITSSSSRSASRMTVSQSGQLPPSPIERAYTLQSPQRRSPRTRSPHREHSYTVSRIGVGILARYAFPVAVRTN